MGIYHTKSVKLETSVVNEIINKSVLRVAPKSTSQTYASNLIRVGDHSSVFGAIQSIDVRVDIEHYFEESQLLDFKNKLFNEIYQELNKEIIALIGNDLGKLVSKDNTDLKTHIENLVKNVNITEITPSCISNNTFMNKLIVENNSIAYGTVQIIKANIYNSCTAKSNNTVNVTNDLANDVNQKAKVKEVNPLEAITSAISSIVRNVLLFGVIFVVVIIFVLLIVSAFTPKNKKDEIKEEIKDKYNNK